ncbi:MAG: sugar phosphate nucleotidyltransferase [Candidatus Saccharibacteria bacterium]|nr:sugar phosphate nucleotidyltransferase [Candidatus Saccharibacteria bacterium]
MSQERKLPTKAVIAAAGFGTRFLPQTKAMPKEMLPLIDKPIIQYVVEELVEAGIKDIIIVGNSNKRSIEDHFDEPSADLLANLRAGGPKKAPLITQVESISSMANFVYIRQKGPYGNATPVICAAHLLGDEPFIYTWADDFFVSSPNSTQQLIDTYKKYGGSVLACKRIENDIEFDRYGVAGGKQKETDVLQVEEIIEKPGRERAPSRLASVSSFLLAPEILPLLKKANDEFDGVGELMIQPSIQKLIDNGDGVFAKEIVNGKYYDTGDKLEYIKTIIDFSLAHETLSPQIEAYIRQKLANK